MLKADLIPFAVSGVADLRFHEIGGKTSLAPLFDAFSHRLNSDFHPILSLEAPRARFRRERATLFESITTADIPLVEVIAGIAMAPAVAPAPMLPRGVALAKARAIAAALTSTSRDEATLPAAGSVATLDEIGACEKRSVRASIDALTDLAGATIPYLPAQGLEGVWIDPAWQHCAQPPPAVGEMLGVLAALSARDFEATGTRALDTLAHHGAAMSSAARDYLVRVAMLSALATAHPENVRAIQDKGAGASAVPMDTTLWQRIYLVAVANARLKPANVDVSSRASP